MEMSQVGILTLTQIWLTKIILRVTTMDLTTLIQAIMVVIVTIQTPGVVVGLGNKTVVVGLGNTTMVVGLGNTMVVVMSLMVVAVAVVTVLECSTFGRETTNHMLPCLYHLLMTNQGIFHQFKHLALLKVCDKYHIEILWLWPILLLMRLNLLSP